MSGISYTGCDRRLRSPLGLSDSAPDRAAGENVGDDDDEDEDDSDNAPGRASGGNAHPL